MVAFSLIAPAQMAAIAEEPVKVASAAIEDLLPLDKIDPRMFRKFDIELDDSVSMDVQRTQTVRKIGFGRLSTVTIVTTPTGTYSSDALLSPNVRYPGIEVTPKQGWQYWPESRGSGHWTSYSQGSIIFYFYADAPAAHT
ncbi:MAG: hypothetical protein EOP22_04475 [Hyphomicrobiales bacterium]|nr:MAG: hypothetical protein EOP22_04475 [Hyphomicrobiales bacterium]